MNDHENTTDPIPSRTAIAELVALGATAADPQALTGESEPYLLIPDGWTFESIAHTLPMPTRKFGTIEAVDAESFIALINLHKTKNTLIYAQVQQPYFVAVINDHGRQEPGWRDHRIKWPCPLSVEWKTWAAADGKQMAQADFARFIEDNLPDIVSPPGAEMLEISRTLEAKKTVDFASSVRLADGAVELTYDEKIKGTALKGKLQLPERFTVGIPVFEGGQRYRVAARLRYRILPGGSLTMWFDLDRPHKVIEDAVQQVRAAVAEKTAVTVVLGNP